MLFDRVVVTVAVAVAAAEREACDDTIIGVCAGEDACEDNVEEGEAEAESEETEADDGKTVGLTVVGFNFRLVMLVFVFIFDGSRELRFDAGSSPILLTDNRDDCWECMKGDIGADDGAELGG